MHEPLTHTVSSHAMIPQRGACSQVHAVPRLGCRLRRCSEAGLLKILKDGSSASDAHDVLTDGFAQVLVEALLFHVRPSSVGGRAQHVLSLLTYGLRSWDAGAHSISALLRTRCAI